MFILNMNISWATAVDDIEERIEVYNYKNKDDFDNFVRETNDSQELRSCFENEEEDIKQ